MCVLRELMLKVKARNVVIMVMNGVILNYLLWVSSQAMEQLELPSQSACITENNFTRICVVILIYECMC